MTEQINGNDKNEISHEYDDTYEPFAEAIRPIDAKFLNGVQNGARLSERPTFFAPATGGDILLHHELGKLIVPGHIVGIDLDERALKRAAERMEESGILNEGNTVDLITGDAAHTGLPDGSRDAVFGLNFIHNVDEPQSIFDEAFRILEPGKRLMISSAYEKDMTQDPHTKEAWNEIFLFMMLYLRRTYGIRELGETKKLDKYTEADFRKMAMKAGFKGVMTWKETFDLDQDQLIKICRYSGFARGVAPALDPKMTSEALEHGINKMLDNKIKHNLPPVAPRGWMFLIADK